MTKADEKPEMVNWYDPRQLLDTARKTFISTTIGENADPRLVAASATIRRIFDYTHELKKTPDDFAPDENKARDEIWIDYVADVGDGFNSTYAVAYNLAQAELRLSGEENPLRRGEILILGGDAVYPTATTEQYRKRLVKPYEMAFKSSGTQKTALPDEADLKEEPHIFALPGNHDWYDSLVAFQRIFCTHFYNNRIFADAWRTRQEISYFALKLPHKWWLLGVDLQLSHNVDVRQLQYLEFVIKQMNRGDRVILCVPEPYWVKAIKYQDLTDIFEEKEDSVEKLESLLKEQGAEIKVYLAGDLHHYRRFEAGDESGIQKITSGGGGAFLHPTHDYDFTKRDKKNKSKGFNWKKNYPSYKKSKQLDWQNLFLFLWNNRTFGILTAVIYVALAWLTHGKTDGEFTFVKAFRSTVNQLVDAPLAGMVVLGMLAALIFFTDSNSKWFKRIGGLIHGLTHLAVILVTGWAGYLLHVWIARQLGFTGDPTIAHLIWFVSVAFVCALGGYFIGSFIMGLYLFVSLHILGRHDNEAFSALKIEDYKNFLRLHINKNGDLTIYPVKIEKVPRDWNEFADASGNIEFYTPKGGSKPDLIEKIPPII
ncbi:MAG: hypothetical protein WA584_18615 [Pyrinomonadaceae bacterium]